MLINQLLTEYLLKSHVRSYRWSSFKYIMVYCKMQYHYDDVIMGAIASLITSLAIVYSVVYSDADKRKHQSSASLAFVWGIHRGPVNSPHKWPVTRKMFPFDDVIMFFHIKQGPIVPKYIAGTKKCRCNTDNTDYKEIGEYHIYHVAIIWT